MISNFWLCIQSVIQCITLAVWVYLLWWIEVPGAFSLMSKCADWLDSSKVLIQWHALRYTHCALFCYIVVKNWVIFETAMMLYGNYKNYLIIAMIHGEAHCGFGSQSQVMQIFYDCFVVDLDKLLNKHWSCHRFETQWHTFDTTVRFKSNKLL